MYMCVLYVSYICVLTCSGAKVLPKSAEILPTCVLICVSMCSGAAKHFQSHVGRRRVASPFTPRRRAPRHWCVRVCACVCVCVCVRACVFTYKHTHTCEHVCKHICHALSVCLCVHVRACLCVNINTHSLLCLENAFTCHPPCLSLPS